MFGVTNMLDLCYSLLLIVNDNEFTVNIFTVTLTVKLA